MNKDDIPKKSEKLTAAVEARQRAYDEAPSEDAAFALIEALSGCGDDYNKRYLRGDPAQRENADRAEEYYLRALDIAEKLIEQGDSVRARDDAITLYCKLSGLKTGRYGNDIPQIKIWLSKACELCEALVGPPDTMAARKELISYYLMIGDAVGTKGQEPVAQIYYEKALPLREAIARESGTYGARLKLAEMYGILIDNYTTLSADAFVVVEYCRKRVELRKELAEEEPNRRSRWLLAIAYKDLGVFLGMTIARGHYEEAQQSYLASAEILEQLIDESPTEEARRMLGRVYFYLAEHCILRKEHEKIEEYFKKAIHIRKALAEEYNDPKYSDDYAYSYYRMGEMIHAKRYYDRARELWTEAAERFPNYQRFKTRLDEVQKAYWRLEHNMAGGSSIDWDWDFE